MKRREGFERTRSPAGVGLVEGDVRAVLAHATRLPLNLRLAGGAPDLLARTRSFLLEVESLSRSSEAVTPLMRVALQHAARVLDGKPDVADLIAAQQVIRNGWRAQPPDPDDANWRRSRPPDSELLVRAKALCRELSHICDKRVQKAERAIASFGAKTVTSSTAAALPDPRAISASLRPFLSYSRQDEATVHTVASCLRNAGVDCWVDSTGLTGGDAIPSELAKAIAKSTHFFVFHSRSSAESRWVSEEVNIAVTHKVNTGSPEVVPVLLDSTPLPALLQKRKGLRFTQFSDGMTQLWLSLGVPEGALWSTSQLQRLRRKAAGLLKVVRWCRQADSFLTVAEETFEELEEAEAYVAGLGLAPSYARSRFARTCVMHTDDQTHAAFDDEFYTYEACYYGGSTLLGALADLIARIDES